MGQLLNWNWPIEWEDGTPAELDGTEFRRVREGEQLSAYFVRSAQEPRGWNRRIMPKLSMTTPVMMTPDGKLQAYPGGPCLRNVEMPLLKRKDGAEPIAGTITRDGTLLSLFWADTIVGSYMWPRLNRVTGAPELIHITRAMVAEEERKAEEAAAMEENPLFGAF